MGDRHCASSSKHRAEPLGNNTILLVAERSRLDHVEVMTREPALNS
jgi:hypothetical protein